MLMVLVFLSRGSVVLAGAPRFGWDISWDAVRGVVGTYGLVMSQRGTSEGSTASSRLALSPY